MNIKLCEKNFIKALRKGSALVLTLSMLSSFTGCCIERVQDENTTSSLISSSLLEEQENKGVYQFNFKKKQQEETRKIVDYDWDNFLESLKNKDDSVFDIVLGGENTSHFAITFHSEKSDMYSKHIRFVDINGDFIDETISYYDGYTDIIHVNDNLTIIEFYYTPNFDNEYIIFNHATGEIKNIKAVKLEVQGDYIIKKVKSVDTANTCYYELLYSNGQLASDEKYSRISFDKETNCLCLVDLDDKMTEIVNSETHDAIRIDGIVIDAYNNYLAIRKNGMCKIYYLEDFYNMTLREITENESFANISIVEHENKIPKFICCSYSHDNNNFYYFLCDENGKQLSLEYNYLNSFNNKEYFYAYNKMDDNNIISFIDKDGNVTASEIKASYIKHIPGTDKVIFYEYDKANDDIFGKAGIIDFNNNIIVSPVYDNLVFYYTSIDKPDEFVVVGFMSDENGEEYDVVFDKEINEIARGKDVEINYAEIAKDYYKPKIKVKEKNNN